MTLLTRWQACDFLVGHLGLRQTWPHPRALLAHLRCIQLDPLDRIGTNADLVAMARIDGLPRGEVYRALLPGHAFEQFANERCLLPLDPLLWERKLVQHAFGFDYVWEVYEPAHKRQWGDYVCPLLHHGRLVGRIEAHAAAGKLVVDQVWRETTDFDDAALRACLARHEACL